VSSLPAVGLVVCSALVNNKVRAVPTIELLDAHGFAAAQPYRGGRVSNPLWGVGAWFPPLAGGKQFKPGKYTCRVSLDNGASLAKQFTITP